MRLYIDSRYRTSDSRSTSDFTVELNEGLDFSSQARVRVYNMCVPNSWYTVEQGLNEFLYLAEKRPDNSWAGRVLGLPAGMYDGPKLATNMRLAMNSESIYGTDPYSVSYNDRTGRIAITLVVPGTWALVDDLSLAGTPLATFSYLGTASRLIPQSFNRNLRIASTQQVGWAQTFTSEFVDLMAIKSLYLTSTSLGNLSNVGPRPGQRDVLCVLPVTQSYGYLICDQDSSMDAEWTDCSGQLLKRLSFQLRDSTGAIVDLHGLDMSFVLSFQSQ